MLRRRHSQVPYASIRFHLARLVQSGHVNQTGWTYRLADDPQLSPPAAEAANAV
jgi:hypothetical protein